MVVVGILVLVVADVVERVDVEFAGRSGKIAGNFSLSFEVVERHEAILKFQVVTGIGDGFSHDLGTVSLRNSHAIKVLDQTLLGEDFFLFLGGHSSLLVVEENFGRVSFALTGGAGFVHDINVRGAFTFIKLVVPHGGECGLGSEDSAGTDVVQAVKDFLVVEGNAHASDGADTVGSGRGVGHSPDGAGFILTVLSIEGGIVVNATAGMVGLNCGVLEEPES